MALRIRDLSLKLDEEEAQLGDKIAAVLGCQSDQIQHWKILRKGIDARKKNNILRVYTVKFNVEDEVKFLAQFGSHSTLDRAPEDIGLIIDKVSQPLHVVVTGMGPAGLFCALTLAESGCQVTLLERGKPVEQRLPDVRHFWDQGVLDENSNVQFGEGGAGTFSDGKLTTRLNHPGIGYILSRLVAMGAPREIQYQAKPHIGSDRLRQVLIRFRRHLMELGVNIRFSSMFSGFAMKSGQVAAVTINHQEHLPCDRLVIAPGHSARDTYQLLAQAGVKLEAKAFAMGVRVEHPRELINQIQYGLPDHPQLPAADYRLTWNDPDSGRGIYSFCMCPGGEVINAASEAGGIVVNGMSDFRRAAALSNSALVVTVSPADFAHRGALAGVEFQRRWERAAWRAGEPGWRAPAQPLLEFLHGRGGRLHSSCRPDVVHACLDDCLPDYVANGLRRALPYFNRKMRGFVSEEATLIGVETRTSAPLRILRNSAGESVSHRGLFPAGEGAGYAGGIMSAALDGLNTAIHILRTTQIQLRSK
ncbi:NAD(P)/FAD-dependent oxidoreductase [Pelovirga terrestris]|uniref:NAD(P)/FAD-dependent oxidoreductase n=1 Tax=Pelovirga terrestris TaxID=2771352 RepID=A0A8J6R4I8_9BACT|nr:NAD(P)/FAD-dependent oxidoreductase [Pelovirga terrestris]MBD1399204.1 NAD(P)/FAD-dependent oxidoreductase [Pelovirga terrestris]